jgi:excisionase family DNA binding protein
MTRPWRSPEPPARYLTSGDVAELMSVSPKTVNRWANEGKLPHTKTLGLHRRYPEAEILELIERMKQTGVTLAAAIELVQPTGDEGEA